MIECRAIISTIEDTRKEAERLGAMFKGEYSFKDIILIPKKETYNLNDDFLRVRVYSKSNWSVKNVVLIRKQTKFLSSGKTDRIILKKEFDAEKDAFEFIGNDPSLDFKKGFEFFRVGWQYQLANNRIFLEDIQNLDPTIEIESENEDELDSMFRKFSFIKRINSSIPEIVRLKLKDAEK